MEDGLTWLQLPAEMSSLRPFTDFVLQGAMAAGLPESSFPKLDLILEEALVNIFRYAYDQPGGEASVGYGAAGPNCLRIDIRDRGRAFNPLDQPAPDLDAPLEDRPIGGLGVFLTTTLAETVQYRRDDGQNILTIQVR